MKKLTNLIIIDASGSMQSKVTEVKNGLKALFDDIREDIKEDNKFVKQDTIVVDFSYNHDIKTLVKAGEELDDKLVDNYSTRGSTALYDAIQYAFDLVGNKKKVFVSIITDGQENDSKKCDYDQITKLITAKRNKGWVITFMGVNEDAIKHAVKMGISAGNTFQYTNTAAGTTQAINSSFSSKDGVLLRGLDGSQGQSGYSGYSGRGGYVGHARETFYMANTRDDFSVQKSTWDNLMEEAKDAKTDENNSGDTN